MNKTKRTFHVGNAFVMADLHLCGSCILTIPGVGCCCIVSLVHDDKCEVKFQSENSIGIIQMID